jgi:hypothetical protein
VFSTGKKKLRFQFYVPYGYPDDASPDERPLLMQEEGLYDVRPVPPSLDLFLIFY